MRKLLTLFFFALCGVYLSAQTPVLIHSHNDYSRTVPFYEAYSQGLYSIEADVFLKDGKLLVGHDIEDLSDDLTLEELYIRPIVTLWHRNGGKPRRDGGGLQLMIELKSDTEPTLAAVTEALSAHPEVFDCTKNGNAVRVVITGRIPSPGDFVKWPAFISFDGDLDEEYTADQLVRVALFSADFRRYCSWNGKGSLIDAEESAVYEAIDKAHSQDKPIRFWGAPEGVTPYYVFLNMGIDYINTDSPAVCAQFYGDWGNKNFRIGESGSVSGKVTGTRKLDKTTRDFSGFRSEKLSLSKPVETYCPTGEPDDSDAGVRNVILLIGDGMGLNQITAADYVNGGLSLLNIRNSGFQINHSRDEFTTDSAAAGSALATGESHSNRHISATDDGTPVPSLSDFFHDRGAKVGVITLGNVADATPAAFYGHCVERDSSDVLTRSLLDGRLSLLCGSGIEVFKDRNDGLDIIRELRRQYSFVKKVDRINSDAAKTICIDERMGEAADEANIELLARATSEGIRKLSRLQSGDEGFFLMVEGAKIDYAGHSRCLPGSVLETLSFDLAVAEALKFADRDGHTLVVVTADHETGGLVLLDGQTESGHILGVYVSDDHTPSMLPVFAYGPKSSSFRGTYKNTAIAERIRDAVR